MLLELCLNLQHLRIETGKLIMPMRKALEYLRALSSGSKSAYKAWTILRLLDEKVTQQYQFDMLQDTFQLAQKPQGWSDEDEQLLYQCLWKMMQ